VFLGMYDTNWCIIGVVFLEPQRKKQPF